MVTRPPLLHLGSVTCPGGNISPFCYSPAVFPSSSRFLLPRACFSPIFGNRRSSTIGDVEKFYKLCNPEKDNLCLYGLPNETWEVTLPPQEVPFELPEPTLGINFVRDGNTQKDWLSLVAAYSDSWLLAMAFYYGVPFGFDKEARRQLFVLINSLPTVFDVVTGSGKKQHETPNDNSKNKSSSKSSNQPNSNSKLPKQPPPKYEEQIGKDKGDEDEDYLCGICENSNGEFWIGCDVCEKRFHGECVHITAEKAKYIKQYKCPSCSTKRSRE